MDRMSHSLERERVTTLTFYAFILLLAYLVYRLFEPFLVPLAWASVAAIVFRTPHQRLVSRLGPTWAPWVSTLAVMLMLVVPAVLLTTAFVREAKNAVDNVEEAFATGKFAVVQERWDWLQSKTLGVEGWDMATIARTAVQRSAGFAAAQAGTVVQGVASFFFHLIVMLFAVYFLFRDGHLFMAKLRNALPFERDKREQILSQTQELIYASVSSSLIVAAVQGALGGVLFAALGLGAPVFWGVVMAFFALLPMLGAWVVWAPAALWLLVSGQITKAIILIAVGAGVVGLVDNILRPALLSGRAQLNGLLVFISLLGGISVFGFIGIVLGPIVVATAASLFDAYTRPEGTPRRVAG